MFVYLDGVQRSLSVAFLRIYLLRSHVDVDLRVSPDLYAWSLTIG